MKIELTIPDELVESTVKSILENYPEAGSGNAIKCTRWKYDKWEYTFVDEENDDKEYKPTKEQFLAAFPLLFTDKWPKGLVPPPMSADPEAWDEWLCQSDAFSFDAFIQLVCLGEVIYG